MTSTHLRDRGSQVSKIIGVRIPGGPASKLWNITINNGKIGSVDEYDGSSAHDEEDTLDGNGRLIAPSLCHAHIHLDKCFLLQHHKFDGLQIEKGDFAEAMEMTSQAKSRFERDDLLERGRQLIEESIQSGVTAMRAFVEVDGIVQLKCLHAGLELKDEFKDRCEVQICAFAQLPLFSGEGNGEQVRKLMRTAAACEGVDVLGSTPYVEDDEQKSRDNVQWIVELAIEHEKHLDLHLDYFLEEDRKPLVWDVLSALKENEWLERAGDKKIALGHCTRLTRFQKHDWTRLRQAVDTLPVTLIGLPTSDLFIMRTVENRRGTLPIVQLIREHGFDAAIAINNVGNAFTPQGSCDPMSIVSLGVGLYQAGTQKDAELLYESVSVRAKKAIGHDSMSLKLEPGSNADFVLFGADASWRCRKSLTEVVYDAGYSRQTIYRGRIIGSTE